MGTLSHDNGRVVGWTSSGPAKVLLELVEEKKQDGRVGDKRSRYSAAIICCGSSLEAQICTGVVWCLARDCIAPQARMGFPGWHRPV